MPMVIGPNGEQTTIPSNMNGQDLREQFGIPENRHVFVTSQDGSQRSVSKGDKVHLKEGDQVEHIGDFDMGSTGSGVV